MMSDQGIAFTPEKVRLLWKAYGNARADQKDLFEFDGHQFVTDYAKYLLEYLDSKLKP